MVLVKDVYFSASTNRSLGVLDIHGDVLAFGSSNAILLYDYQVSIFADRRRPTLDNQTVAH